MELVSQAHRADWLQTKGWWNRGAKKRKKGVLMNMSGEVDNWLRLPGREEICFSKVLDAIKIGNFLLEEWWHYIIHWFFCRICARETIWCLAAIEETPPPGEKGDSGLDRGVPFLSPPLLLSFSRCRPPPRYWSKRRRAFSSQEFQVFLSVEEQTIGLWEVNTQ